MITNTEFFNELDTCFKKAKSIIKLANNNGFVINDPELVNHILAKNHKNYVKGPEFDRVKLLTGAGLIVIDGKKWRKHRQLIRPAFSKGSFPFFTEVIEHETARLCNHWESVAKQGREVNISIDMSRYALNIILECIFSSSLDDIKATKQGNPFDIFIDNTNRDIDLARTAWELRQKIKELIVQRRSKTVRHNDMLDAMMYSTLRDGSSFSDNELIDEIMTLIVAGHETSAITLGWMWLLLSLNPQVEQRLRDLLIELPNSFEKDISFSQYIEQVMAETLRLYPPVWVYSRKAIADDHWKDICIPANSTVFLSPYYLQRHPQRWDSPDEFMPERFDGKSICDDGKGDYIPFSSGPRRCIGDHFSLIEARILFSKTLPKFRLNAEDDYQIALEPAVNLKTAKPINMTVELLG